MLQTTPQGDLAIQRLRKATMQLLAERTGLQPGGALTFNMRDYVKTAGGQMFVNMLKCVVNDDCQAARIVAVLNGSAFPLPWHMDVMLLVQACGAYMYVDHVFDYLQVPSGD